MFPLSRLHVPLFAASLVAAADMPPKQSATVYRRGHRNYGGGYGPSGFGNPFKLKHKKRIRKMAEASRNRNRKAA